MEPRPAALNHVELKEIAKMRLIQPRIAWARLDEVKHFTIDQLSKSRLYPWLIRLFPSGTKPGLPTVSAVLQGDQSTEKIVDLQNLLVMACGVL